MASMVVGLEDNEEAAQKAGQILSELGLDNAAVVSGPLEKGVAKQGPFDVIVIAAGVEAGLEGLMTQLSEEGGRLVTIIQEEGVGHATLITRNGNAYGHRVLFEAHPAGVLPGFIKPVEFVF